MQPVSVITGEMWVKETQERSPEQELRDRVIILPFTTWPWTSCFSSLKAESSKGVGCAEETISKPSSSLVLRNEASNQQVPSSQGEDLLREALAEGEGALWGGGELSPVAPQEDWVMCQRWCYNSSGKRSRGEWALLTVRDRTGLPGWQGRAPRVTGKDSFVQLSYWFQNKWTAMTKSGLSH